MRSLNKKERVFLKNEQRRCRLLMELNSAETGLKLQQFAQKMHQQHGYDTESDIEEGEKPAESKREWRIQYDSER